MWQVMHGLGFRALRLEGEVSVAEETGLSRRGRRRLRLLDMPEEVLNKVVASRLVRPRRAMQLVYCTLRVGDWSDARQEMIEGVWDLRCVCKVMAWRLREIRKALREMGILHRIPWEMKLRRGRTGGE